jgi:outer membrane protein OmpA-like peptidoglycan-associated protein
VKRIGVLSIFLAACVSTVLFSQQSPVDELIGKVFIIYFPPGSSSFSDLSHELQNANREAMEALARLLTENPILRVRAIGHANAVFDDTAREELALLPLSFQRACEAAKVLTFYGISRSRITVAGLGSKYPLTPKAFIDELYRNRRVEFMIKW